MTSAVSSGRNDEIDEPDKVESGVKSHQDDGRAAAEVDDSGDDERADKKSKKDKKNKKEKHR